MSQGVSINFQGSTFTLLVINIYTKCISDIHLALIEKIKSAPHFFNTKTPVVINLSNINYYSDWINVYKIMLNIGLFVVGVCCCDNEKLKNEIIQSGLPILTKGSSVTDRNINTNFKKKSYDKTLLTEKTQVIYNPIRSGQKIYAQNRDLIIISNVSFGAEIISDGNIHIYGAMRGRVLAGATGNKDSQIFCTNLFPELVAIGKHYLIIDQIPSKFLGKSARFYLKNNNLVIQHIL